MHDPLVRVSVQWRKPEEDGRTAPPLGPIYAPVARLDDGIESIEDAQVFSVVLERSTAPTNGDMSDWTLRLLFPEKLPEIAAQLVEGQTLLIHEGRREVAVARIVEVVTGAATGAVAVGSNT